MSKRYSYLSEFKHDNRFYPEITILITIKSFDLQAIRNRYLKTKDKTSKRTGSAERRAVSTGGVAKITFHNGQIKNAEILAELTEPRGIDYKGGILAVSSENKVFVLDNNIKEINDPWFSYIHTVDIHPDNYAKILVSSSGFDAFFEYDLIAKEKTNEWFAWENGFDHGYDPDTGEKVYLTRQKEQAELWKMNSLPHMLIDDPEKQVLPTAKRAAFINSVVYDTQNTDHIIATFFHEGAVFGIDKNTGDINMLIDSMKSPHGGCRFKNQFMATNTKGGEVVIGSMDNQYRYRFDTLKGKPDMLSGFEWIQNSVAFNGNIIAIDSNRNAFVIFNPENKMIDLIPYDNNWAVQDIITGKPDADQLSMLREISNK